MNPRRRNGTVRCMFFPIGAGAPVTRGSGEGFAGRTGLLPHAPSQDIRFRFFHRLSRRSVCECIKMFAPKLKMALVLFVCTNGGRVHAHSLLRKE